MGSLLGKDEVTSNKRGDCTWYDNGEMVESLRIQHNSWGKTLQSIEGKRTLDEKDRESLKRQMDETGHALFVQPLQDLKNTIREQENEINQLKRKLKATEGNNNATLHALDKRNTEFKDMKQKQQHELLKCQQECEELRLRLSKLVSAQLTKDNPNIANLSDKNRPTKLGEMYSELYDNEWTYAFDALSTGRHEDRDAIENLRVTLMDVFEFCKNKSQDFNQTIEAAANMMITGHDEQAGSRKPTTDVMRAKSVNMRPAYTNNLDIRNAAIACRWKPKRKTKQAVDASAPVSPVPKEKGLASEEIENGEKCCESGSGGDRSCTPQAIQMGAAHRQTIVAPIEINDEIKQLQKDVSMRMIPIVQKTYLSSRWDDDCIPAMKPFIKKCVFISWMMVVQSPPMCFHVSEEQGDRLDGNMYKAYTQNGKMLDYVVWPPMLLCNDGPLICKGTAQGKNE